MSEYFASIPISNSTRLCVGTITRAEAEAASVEGLPVDGRGYYLFLADEASPSTPIQILASFVSAYEAATAARLFGTKLAAA
jgi:hypothetical protein